MPPNGCDHLTAPVESTLSVPPGRLDAKAFPSESVATLVKVDASTSPRPNRQSSVFGSDPPQRGDVSTRVGGGTSAGGGASDLGTASVPGPSSDPPLSPRRTTD